MEFFGLYSPPIKIKGSIGFYGLSDWWEKTFTKAEQIHIAGRFLPLGGNSSSLIKGDVTFSSQSVISFLTSLSGWFSKSADRHLAYKIIEQAENLIEQNSRIIDVHFLFSKKLELLYKDRNSSQDGLALAIKACEQQIDIAPQVAQAFLQKNKNDPFLPSHAGFNQLVIIKEKQQNFTATIELCVSAISQKWPGDWDKRITRCQKKLKKLQ